ncbi:MAG: creatininase family protein [Rhodobiaceae bacterium]|nr:creatininase family protein [Rhodobiaceae bacterium]MCC0050104.1 creatininase family protein [Rhodobiaceae bacterium]
MAAGRADRKRWRRWSEIGRTQLADIDLASAVAVLPIAALEQHGPHLPFGVDLIINEGLLDRAQAAWPGTCDVVSLPCMAVGKSDEHAAFAGTLSLDAATLTEMLVETGHGIAATGFRRLVILSSHGGNSEVMSIAARRLRLEADMLAVPTSWARMGLPEGLIGEDEQRFGIHGGDIETSLMLHLRPDLVEMDKAENFVSAAQAMETGFDVLRGTGPTGFAWATGDLNASGALGDAAAGTAEKGSAIAAHQVSRLHALLGDMSRFDLAGLSD